jgi:hypothetical protein
VKGREKRQIREGALKGKIEICKVQEEEEQNAKKGKEKDNTLHTLAACSIHVSRIGTLSETQTMEKIPIC